MLYFSNAKINIGLNINSKRADGFHNIESVFYPVFPQDAIEFVESTVTQLSQSGIVVEGDISENLIIKSYYLLKEKYKLPNLHFHIHKTIPFGAGLGAGSANATQTLQALIQHFNISISSLDLSQLTQILGSDCVFFTKNTAQWVSGKGEILEDIELNLSNYQIVIVHPNFGISTQEAYAQIVPQQANRSIKTLVKEPISQWKETIHNDFEVPLFKKYPILQDIKSELYAQGAIYSSMSGSGSAIYGIFKNIPETLSFPNFWVWKGILNY